MKESHFQLKISLFSKISAKTYCISSDIPSLCTVNPVLLANRPVTFWDQSLQCTPRDAMTCVPQGPSSLCVQDTLSYFDGILVGSVTGRCLSCE